MMFVVLSLCAVTAAQDIGRIESMKLLAPDVGWSATNEKLFWTTDNGAHWKDITPKLDHKQQNVSSVFFLDTSSGWALLKCSDGRDPKVDDVCFEFASTNDAGLTWSIMHPRIVDRVLNRSDIGNGLGFSGRTFLDFADSQHGWAVLKKGTGLQTSAGEMLRTLDGGRTWVQLENNLPMGEHFHFVTAKDGWIARSDNFNNLYVTHDAGTTWVKSSLQAPAEAKLPNDSVPSYALPVFEDPQHGFLMVGYSDGDHSVLVIFATNDLGKTWKADRVLPSVDGVTTISSETLMTVSTSVGLDKITLTRLPLGEKAIGPTSETADVHGLPIRYYNLGAGYDALSMIDGAHGWLLANVILATSNGGVTWTDITPGGPAPPLGTPNGGTPKKMSVRKKENAGQRQALLSPTPTGSNVSMHMGFDTYNVPLSSQMATWMSSSPY
jgi:photosystem II stability/assembly factor-like uncharacterized protein